MHLKDAPRYIDLRSRGWRKARREHQLARARAAEKRFKKRERKRGKIEEGDNI